MDERRPSRFYEAVNECAKAANAILEKRGFPRNAVMVLAIHEMGYPWTVVSGKRTGVELLLEKGPGIVAEACESMRISVEAADESKH